MRVPVVVVGAGHAGLAISRELTERSVDHVVLERGEVANTWRTERWDSLRLLTPNWQTRLPGFDYDGDDPDGFMTVPEVISFIDRYARLIDAPLQTRTTVESVRQGVDGYEVVSDRGTWSCEAVVVASGGFNIPKLPPVAGDLPPSIVSVTPRHYRNPDELPDGGVLVVGASATGIQIADEILGSGRPVTVAVGEHVRLPRVYRDRDVFWWMEKVGRLDERYDEVDDILRSRHTPSPQLVGTPDRTSIDLNALTRGGARLVGRLGAVSDGHGHFSGSLANVCRLADLKMGRILTEFDEWAAEVGVDGEVGPSRRWEPTVVDESPLLSIDLAAEFDTVLWATGFRPDHSWLELDVFDRKGALRHDGGVVTDAPGLYRIGLNFLRRRKSSFIHGAEDDARDLADHLSGYLRSGRRDPLAAAIRS